MEVTIEIPEEKISQNTVSQQSVKISANAARKSALKGHPLLADIKPGKSPSFQDLRFVELYDAAMTAAEQGGGTINMWQVNVTVGPLPTPDDLEHVQMLQLNGKWYSFTPCLKDRAAAAKDGLLGSFNTDWGRREAQEVEWREAHEKKRAEERAKKEAVWRQCRSNRSYARTENERLWGPELADAAWAYNAHNSHPEVKSHKVVAIAKTCLKFLANADALEGNLPDFQGMLNNKYLSRKVPTRLEEVWNQAKAMAEFIYRRVPVERAPGFYGKMPSTPVPSEDAE